MTGRCDRRQNVLTPSKIKVRPLDLLEGEGARAGIFLKKEIPGFGYARGKKWLKRGFKKIIILPKQLVKKLIWLCPII